MIPAINCMWGYVSSSCGKNLFTYEKCCDIAVLRDQLYIYMHVNRFLGTDIQKCKNNLY